LYTKFQQEDDLTRTKQELAWQQKTVKLNLN